MPDRVHEKTNKKRAEYSLEEVALYNLSLFADHVWCEEEVDFHRAACQRTWVRYNRMKEACSRTSVLDLLAQVRLEQKKTVRDTIPFSHLAQYGNYEYDEGAEKNYVPEATVAALQPLPSDLSVHPSLSRRPHLFTSLDLSTLQMETETFTCPGQEQERALLMASYADQLEYTAGYHDDPSLGRAEDPPLGNFGRICGPFDPIKFSGLAKEILKVEEKKAPDSWEPAAMNNVWRDNCISWANWLLCIYPEFLQNLCNCDEISKNMPPPDQTLDMAVDYLEILNRPISLIDVQQFLQPRLQSLSRYRQGLKRLYEQIASQDVRNLWMTDSEQAMNVTLTGPSSSDSGAPTPPVKLESEVYIGLSASDESALSTREMSLSQLTMVSVPHRHRPMTKPRESGHKSKSSRRRGSDGKREGKRHGGSTPAIASKKELLSSKPVNKVQTLKLPLGSSSLNAPQGRSSVPTTPRTPSAPILKELRAEDFPTLSEAAIMNFRQPVSSSGHSATPARQSSPQAKSRSVAAVILERPDQPLQANGSSPSDWTNFVDMPMQRSIHSKSDTDLHRSTSQGSNPQSSPISESSGGLHSESDSDIQLQESFQRCEDDACFLLRSTASGQSSSSEDSCLTSALLSSDDAHMNIHAPSFRPRGKTPQKQQLTRHLLSLFHAPQNAHPASSESPTTTKTQSTETPSVSPLSTMPGHQRVQPKAQHQRGQQPRPEAKQRSSTTTTVTVYPGASRQYAWQPLNQPLQPVPLQPSVTSSASASGFYGARRIPLTFQQQPQQWRPTFPPIAQGSMLQPSLSQMLSGQSSVPSCKPPPGFETIYSIGDGSNSHPVSAHPSRQSQPPPQLALPPSVGPMVPPPSHRFFPATTSVAQQHAHGYTTTNASTSVGYFPQAYSNQQDMFPYHSSTGIPSLVQSQAAQQQPTTASTETTSARTLVAAAAAAAMLSPRQGPGVTSSNMEHIRSTFGSGLLPVPDSGAAYLMNVHQQLLYPLAFPNQFVPSCRYLVPPPVRMPAPQQFLPPQLLPPQPQPSCYTPGSTTGSDLSFAWTRFDPSQSSVLPGYTTNSLFPNQFSPVSGGGTATTTSNGATGVPFLQPDGIVNSQQQNRALGLYLAGLSGYSDGSGGMGTTRDEGTNCGRGTFWRHHYPQSHTNSNLQMQQQFLIQRAAALNQSDSSNTTASTPGGLTDDGGRKGRSRKREPSNLVQLVGLADLVALGGKRRERNKRMRSHKPQTQQPRQAHGTVDSTIGSTFASPQEGGSLVTSHETPSEDSEEQSVTQNEESSEDWAADAQTTDVDDVGEGTDGVVLNLERANKHFAEESTEPALDTLLTAAYDAEHSILLSDIRTKKRRRSLNTSGSSRSSEADERGASKIPLPSTSTGTNQRQSRPRYRSYKECLQTTVKAPSSQSTADSPYDDINYSTMDSFKVVADKGRSGIGSSVGLDTIELGSSTDLSLAILQVEAASSSSPPDTRSPSPDVGAPADTPEEDSFESGGGGGGGSSNVSAGCNSPLVLTPRQCGTAEPSLLSHLAKWSAAKIADKAEGMSDVIEGPENANYGFRWIPEDDLERQAAEEYCPSKESSHEKLADRALPLHRSATGRGTSPASPTTNTPPATATHGPGPTTSDAAAAATPTQVRGTASAERSTSGVKDEPKGRPTSRDVSVSDQDPISPGIEPVQANVTSVCLHGTTAQRHSKQTEVEKKSEISYPVMTISDMVIPINTSKTVPLHDVSTRGASVTAKVTVSCCRKSLDDMQIPTSPVNRIIHSKLRLPKMTTVVDLEASLKAMATAASSGGRGAAENGKESLRSSDFQHQGLKTKSSVSPVQIIETESQKSDLSKVVLKQQSEILSVLLGVSKQVPTPLTNSQKRNLTGDIQQRTEEKQFGRSSVAKLLLHSSSNIATPHRPFDWHSQTDPIMRQLIEGQRRMRSIRQRSKVDRKLKKLGAIAEGMMPTDRAPRLIPRRVLIGREKGIKRRDEILGPGWDISGAIPVTGYQLQSTPKSNGSGICVTHLQNILADKHGAKDEKWVIGQDKNAVRQDIHHAKRRQPRSRKGRHAPVVRLKSSSGNRKSRHELCMSSLEQSSASQPANLENDNAAMMGFLSSATGIVKRLVYKTF